MSTPCEGCKGECCQGKGFKREAPLQETDWGKYDEYIKDGIHYLSRKANYDCVYYEKEGCTLGENRPATCHAFFCWQWIPEGLPKHVFNEAIKRI